MCHTSRHQAGTQYLHVIHKQGIGVNTEVSSGQDIGTIGGYNHVHFDLLAFDQSMSEYLEEYYEHARNPLDYPDLADYPDQNTPTVSELRFNTDRVWNG
jgi:hypothetical protein